MGEGEHTAEKLFIGNTKGDYHESMNARTATKGSRKYPAFIAIPDSMNPGMHYGMNPGMNYGVNPGMQYGMNPGMILQHAGTWGAWPWSRPLPGIVPIPPRGGLGTVPSFRTVCGHVGTRENRFRTR